MSFDRRVVTVVAVLIGVGLAGGLALGAKLDTRKTTVDIDEGGPATAVAKCKRGDRAISGGWFMNDENSAVPHASHPSGKRRWRSTNSEFSVPNPDETLTGFAYCGDLKVSTESKQASVPPDDVATAKAKCPKGETAVSGGYRATPGEVAHPFVNQRAGRRAWKVKAINYSDDPAPLRAYARCADRKPLDVEREAQQLEYDGSGIDEHKIEARCGNGEEFVSGGFKSSFALTKGGPFFTAAYKKGPRGWEVRAAAAVVEPTITSFAYCQG